MSLLSLDGMVTESVPCARLLPCEVRPGDVFRTRTPWAIAEGVPAFCYTVAANCGEFDERVTLMDADGWRWEFGVDEVVEVIHLGGAG